MTVSQRPVGAANREIEIMADTYRVNYRLTDMQPVIAITMPDDWKLEPGTRVLFPLPDGRTGTMHAVQESPKGVWRMRWSCEDSPLDGEIFEFEPNPMTDVFMTHPQPSRVTRGAVFRQVAKAVTPFIGVPSRL